MGNKMNFSKFKMILKEEVVRSLSEAVPNMMPQVVANTTAAAVPVAAPPPPIPAPVAGVQFDSDQMVLDMLAKTSLKNEKDLPLNFAGAQKRQIELFTTVSSRQLESTPGQSGAKIKLVDIKQSLKPGPPFYQFWDVRYRVLSQYVMSAASVSGLITNNIGPLNGVAQNFFDAGYMSSAAPGVKNIINSYIKNSKDVINPLQSLLKLLGYSNFPNIKWNELDQQQLRNLIVDFFNISLVPLANLINIPKQTIVSAPNANPNSKNPPAKNWDQYVKMTPGGAEVKTAWEAYAATGQVKPDYYSFVNWYNKSKSARPDLWDDGPTNVARLLQAKANLFALPPTPPAPSITPGQAAAPTPKP
jgi:hypothetical protein